MASLFRPVIIRYTLPNGSTRTADGQRVNKNTAGAVRKKHKAKKWYTRLPDQPRPVPLSANKAVAQQMLNELVRKAELGKIGVVDLFEQHRKRPLAEHLDDFHKELSSRDNAPRYVTMVVSRLRSLLDGCRFVFLSDLSASRAADWLAGLRRQGRARVQLPADQEWFTLREAARLLGVKPASVGAAVRRNRLEAEGNGKARRLSRAAVEALQDRVARGVSVQTTNDYLSALKSFGRWLVKDRRTAENPFAHLEGGNAGVDRRHDRRELTANELRSVLDAARNSAATFRGLAGADRFHLYATACGTGFRASALASLTPASFDLDAGSPIVTLAARHAKNRKTKVQPLPADVAELLRVPEGQTRWRTGLGRKVGQRPPRRGNAADRPGRRWGALRRRGTGRPTVRRLPRFAAHLPHVGRPGGNRPADAARTGRVFDAQADRPLLAPPTVRPRRRRREAAAVPTRRQHGQRVEGHRDRCRALF